MIGCISRSSLPRSLQNSQKSMASSCNFAGKIRSLSNSTHLPQEPSAHEKIKFFIATLTGLTAGGYVGYSFIKDIAPSLTLPVTLISSNVGAGIGMATFLGGIPMAVSAGALCMIALDAFTKIGENPSNTQKLALTRELDSIENKQRYLSLRMSEIRKELLALSPKTE